jgi:glutathione gamma-glutamylcysteinyltransferase
MTTSSTTPSDFGCCSSKSSSIGGSAAAAPTCPNKKTKAAPPAAAIDDHGTTKDSNDDNKNITPAVLVVPAEPVSFYRRPLPDSCVAFSSRQGRQRLANSMATGGLKSFFALMEQHTTQTEPAYCGLATLVMALNALAVDPLRTWKGPWRWYAEEAMVNCCLDLKSVQAEGVTLAVFAGIANCQGLSVQVTYAAAAPDDGDEDEDETVSLERFRRAVEMACVENDHHYDNPDDSPLLPTASAVAATTTTTTPPIITDEAAAVSLDTVLVVSYSRKVLGQTGSGHFSPIVAYDRLTDSVLIADTARFKYGAHWVHLPLLFAAMRPIDPDTGRSRGYVLLQSPRHRMPNNHDDDDNNDREQQQQPSTQLLRALPQQESAPAAHPLLQKSPPPPVAADHHRQKNNDQLSVTTTTPTASFAEFHRTLSCPDGMTGLPRIWQLVLPHLKPVTSDAAARYSHVERLRSLLDRLWQSEPQPQQQQQVVSPSTITTTTTATIPTTTTTTTIPTFPATTATATTFATSKNTPCRSFAPCHSQNCRIIALGADQAIYLVYLATLGGEKTKFLHVIDRANVPRSDTTVELFWQEVLLLRQDLGLE